jgi:hypothetical protein
VFRKGKMTVPAARADSQIEQNSPVMSEAQLISFDGGQLPMGLWRLN